MSLAKITNIINKASCSTHGMIGTGDFQIRLACDGKLFYYQDKKAITDPYVLHIKTGEKCVCMTAEVQADATNVITLNEDVVCSADGTALIMRAYNRNVPDDGLLAKLYHSPTITTAGTVIKTNQAGWAAAPGLAQAGASGRQRMYTLKKNTSYTYTFTGASNIVIGIEFFENGAS